MTTNSNFDVLKNEGITNVQISNLQSCHNQETMYLYLPCFGFSEKEIERIKLNGFTEEDLIEYKMREECECRYLPYYGFSEKEIERIKLNGLSEEDFIKFKQGYEEKEENFRFDATVDWIKNMRRHGFTEEEIERIYYNDMTEEDIQKYELAEEHELSKDEIDRITKEWLLEQIE